MDKVLGKNSYGILLGVGVGLALGISQDSMGLGIGVGVALGAAFSQGLRGEKKDNDDNADVEKAENGGDN